MEAVSTQALAPALWSTHGTVESSRRYRKVEPAVKPKEGDFSFFQWFGHNSLDYCDARMYTIGNRGYDSGAKVPCAC